LKTVLHAARSHPYAVAFALYACALPAG